MKMCVKKKWKIWDIKFYSCSGHYSCRNTEYCKGFTNIQTLFVFIFDFNMIAKFRDCFPNTGQS